jgi:hypothetical protein
MNPVEQHLSPLLRHYVWGVQWDPDVGLSMSFGSPHLRIREPLEARPTRRLVVPRGQWWLWVYMARWRISFNGARAASTGSSKRRSSPKRIRRAIRGLDGQLLTDFKVVADSGGLSLAFDLGGRLDVRPLKGRKEDELWLLYAAGDTEILAVRSDGKYAVVGDEGRETWRAIV